MPIKCGIYGPQGSGKSTSAALMAAAISTQLYNHAPVFVVDPEAAWQFLKRRIFDVEGIDLIQRPYSTFKDMVDSLHEGEKVGACCWIVDPLTLIWSELLDSFQQKLGYIPIDKWQDVRQLWNCDYIRYFLNCDMNCLALGSLATDFEEREETLKNGETKTKLVKVGTKFKAGGGESFGYEPHRLFELWLERKNRKRARDGRRRSHGPPRRCDRSGRPVTSAWTAAGFSSSMCKLITSRCPINPRVRIMIFSKRWSACATWRDA